MITPTFDNMGGKTDDNNNVIVDKLNWKGLAKKKGMQMGDIISNFKIDSMNNTEILED